MASAFTTMIVRLRIVLLLYPVFTGISASPCLASAEASRSAASAQATTFAPNNATPNDSTRQGLVKKLLATIAERLGDQKNKRYVRDHLTHMNTSAFHPKSVRVVHTALATGRGADFQSCSLSHIHEATRIVEALKASMEAQAQWAADFQPAPSAAAGLDWAPNGLNLAEWEAAFNATPTTSVKPAECPDLSGVYQCQTTGPAASEAFNLLIDMQSILVDENHLNVDPTFVADVDSESDDDSDDDADSDADEELADADAAPAASAKKATAHLAPRLPPAFRPRIKAAFYSDREDVIAFKGLKQYRVQFVPENACFEVHEPGRAPYFSFFSPRPLRLAAGQTFGTAALNQLQFNVDPRQPHVLTLKVTTPAVKSSYRSGVFLVDEPAEGQPITCSKLPIRSSGFASEMTDSQASSATHRRPVSAADFDPGKLITLTAGDELSHSHCDRLKTSSLIAQLLSWSEAAASSDHRSVSSHMIELVKDGMVQLVPICDRQKRIVSVGGVDKSFELSAIVSSPLTSAKGAGRAVLLEVFKRCMMTPQCRYIKLKPIDAAMSFYFKMEMDYDLDEGQFFFEKHQVLSTFPEFRRALK